MQAIVWACNCVAENKRKRIDATVVHGDRCTSCELDGPQHFDEKKCTRNGTDADSCSKAAPDAVTLQHDSDPCTIICRLSAEVDDITLVAFAAAAVLSIVIASSFAVLVNKADEANPLRVEDKLEQKLDKMDQKMDYNMQYMFLGFVVLALLMVFKDKHPAQAL